MKEFEDQLRAEGIAPSSVDEASCVGGDHPSKGSKWKTYYRSRCFPDWGVLIAHTGDEGTIEVLMGRLNEEVANYELLKAAGHDVPRTAEGSCILVDHFSAVSVAAMVVEHIDGWGPFKARTAPTSLMRVANGLGEEARKTAKAAWATLQARITVRAPMDLQVMLSHTGRIVIIDPEKTTKVAGYTLNDWDDSIGAPPTNGTP